MLEFCICVGGIVIFKSGFIQKYIFPIVPHDDIDIKIYEILSRAFWST